MMSQLPSHDELAIIAKEDPEHLEQIRQHFVDRHISAAPAYMQRRLRGLQFQVDSLRKLHNAPMGSCIAISQLMYESLNKMRDAISNLDPANSDMDENIETAQILSFPQIR